MALFTVTFQGYYASTPSVGYQVLNPDGSVHQARTTTGVVHPVGNLWQVNIADSDLVIPCSIVWDDGLSTPNYATSSYNGSGGGGGTPVIIVSSDESCGT